MVLIPVTVLAGCGPNDRIRDTYWGKADDYQPVERDQYGEPVLKDDAAKESNEDTEDRNQD
jgi:hypothetical protein